MGKRYDAKAVMGYCDAMTDAYNEYGHAADHVQGACVSFADNDTFTGAQAEATKELVGVAEVALIDDILALNETIKKAQNEIMDYFASSVDEASNALIDEDTLKEIKHDLQGYAESFDAIGTQVESIYARLQKFSKYGSFTKPDFDSGRNAAAELCGGDSGGGYLRECIQKLIDYDTDATAMLKGMALDDEMAAISERLRRSSAAMQSYQMYEVLNRRYDVNSMSIPQYAVDGVTLLSSSGQNQNGTTVPGTRADLNRLEAEAMKREIEAVGRKIKNETDSENVFDINPNEINVSGIPVEVSHWDVDPSLFESKERAKLDASTDYYAQMSPAQQRMALKLYEDYVATEGKIADEKSANDIAHLMERHFRVTGDSAREAEAVKLQTRTAGMATAAAAGAVDALVNPLDAVAAAAYALSGQKSFTGAWKEMQAAHDFKDVQTQHPIAYLGGEIAGNVILYKGATQSLGSISKVSEATTKAGNAIASKAGSVLSGNAGEIVKNAGNAIGNVIQGTIPDILLDTIPTEIANVSDGMSAGEVAWDTVKNVSGNVAFNVIGEAAPAVLKAIGGGDAAKNTAQSMPLSMDAAAQQASKSDAFDLDNKTLQIGDDALGANRKAVDNLITDGSHLEGGKLKSNVTYQTGEHNYIYKTNDEGLIVSVHADDLQLKAHDGRLRHNPNTYGKEAGDHAGHLIGDRFGGSADLDNLVSQARRVNLSEYRKIENQWEKAIHEGKKVTVDIKINYDVGGVRPASFKVLYTIDGDLFVKNIRN